MVNWSIFFATTWAFTTAVIASSPRDRKTKSPRSFDITGSDVMEIASPRSSPRFKRLKTVTINEEVLFHGDDEEYFEEIITPIIGIEAKDHRACEIVRPAAVKQPEESTPGLPRPILKIKIPSKTYTTPMDLFMFGSVRDLKSFYDRGVHLSLPEGEISAIFKHLLETFQSGKLKMIYSRDQLKLIEFVLKNDEISSETILSLASTVLSKGNEEAELNLLESARNDSTLELRVIFYLYAVDYDPRHVYNIVTSLLYSGYDNHEVIREIISQYNRKSGTMPLMSFAVQNGFDIATVVEFEPSELDRLDTHNCSIIYYAACEGNLELLESIEAHLMGRQLSGVCPLIGAAENNRDDSLNVFMRSESWLFSRADYEDAAFTAANYGNFRFFTILIKAGRVDLYCHRGNLTFLSAALKNEEFGFAKLLVERLDFNVNFVGDDPINPDGHALVYVLKNLGGFETFLKRGASRNIKITIDLGDEERLVTLDEYLVIMQDSKLIKLLAKY